MQEHYSAVVYDSLRGMSMVTFPFCHSNEKKNGHHACMDGSLMTANQSEIREVYLVTVMATGKVVNL